MQLTTNHKVKSISKNYIAVGRKYYKFDKIIGTVIAMRSFKL